MPPRCSRYRTHARFCRSHAFPKNKGIQPLLDAVVRYLPNPSEVENKAIDLDQDGVERALAADPEAKTVALTMRLKEDSCGPLTYVRICRGASARATSSSTPGPTRRSRSGMLDPDSRRQHGGYPGRRVQRNRAAEIELVSPVRVQYEFRIQRALPIVIILIDHFPVIQNIRSHYRTTDVVTPLSEVARYEQVAVIIVL